MPAMEIVTWNVNSLRARMPRVLPWLEALRPDVVCLQETKVQDELFPREPFEDLGYQVEILGQKTYNGVAILSRHGMEDVVRGMPDDEPDEQRRVIAATIGDLMLVNVYVVNGQTVGSEKYAYKLEWMERLHDYLDDRFDMHEKVVMTGDFNVTFDDRDVYDPRAWDGKVLCSDPERDALAKIMSCGMRDALRKFTEASGQYTWWDFRTAGFKRGLGMRIDHFLMSNPAYEACSGVRVDLDARGGEKPSDHAPVIATIDVNL